MQHWWTRDLWGDDAPDRDYLLVGLDDALDCRHFSIHGDTLVLGPHRIALAGRRPAVVYLVPHGDRDQVEQAVRTEQIEPVLAVPSPTAAANAALREQLAALHLDGRWVMVHASLRSLGPLPGGADGLLDLLYDAVGTGGLLMLLCNEEDQPFHPLESPAWEELGALAEVFRRRCDAVSDHPIARFGAWGRDANELVTDVPLGDYYGPGSPLERLYQRDGLVLRLGADPDTVTLCHYAEYLARVPHKRRVTRSYQRRGQPERTLSCLDDEHGIRPYEPGVDYFPVILEAFLATGGARVGTVGTARSEVLPSRSFVDFAAAWMERELLDLRRKAPPGSASGDGVGSG